MRVLNSAQMREADRRTTDDIGIPSLVLMENAGRQAVAAMEAMYGDLLERQVAILCGRGSNGGDGFVVARTLAQRGVDVAVFLLGQVSEVRGDARVNLEILGRLGLTVVYVTHDQQEALAVSDQIIVMDQAMIAQHGRPRDLYEQPANLFVADFIGDANIVDAEIAEWEGDRARVRLGGLAISLPHRGVPSGPAKAAIRPDALRLSREMPPGPAPPPNRRELARRAEAAG